MSEEVLVVEDSFVAALELESILAELGYTMIGPAPTNARAQELLGEYPDVAFVILDVSLRESDCAPTVRVLQERSTPFVLATGYSNPTLPGCDISKMVVIHKPILRADLAAAIEKICASRRVHIEASSSSTQ